MKIIIFGPPGAGKGTQAKILAEKLKLEYISTGDIFREEIKNKTKIGLQIKDIIARGDYVSDELTLEVLKKNIKKFEDNFILDGFPRTSNQARALDNIIKIDKVIVLDVPYHLIKSRLLRRSGIEGREDDTEETIKNRFKTYREKTGPLLKYYENKLILVDGDQPIEEIQRFLIEKLKR